MTSGWKVTEPAEGYEGIVESGTVMVVHRKFGCKPNQKNGCYKSFGLVENGEFINDKENRVHIGHRTVMSSMRAGMDLTLGRSNEGGNTWSSPLPSVVTLGSLDEGDEWGSAIL